MCSFCEEHYDPKMRWCYLKKMRIPEPLHPHRCRGYDGVTVTVETLKYLRDRESKQMRIDNI